MTTLETLKKAIATAERETWFASCSTDGFIDLKPYWQAEQAARDALKAYQAQTHDLSFYCPECDHDWADQGPATPSLCPCCKRPVMPEIVEA